MKNAHRNLRLLIAVVFTFEGLLLGYTTSNSLREVNLFTAFLSMISLLVLAGSLYMVARVDLEEDRIEVYETTEDGYVSIVTLLGGVESEMETFEESVSDIEVPVVDSVQVVPVDHPIFDVDTSQPLYDESAPTHAMVLVGHIATEAVAIEEVPSTQGKALNLPEKPSKKPFMAVASEPFTLDMSAFLPSPLNDPEYLVALEHINEQMGSTDVLVISGKSYGLGARGNRIPGTNKTAYTKTDVKKMIVKFISKPSPKKEQ